MAKTQIIYLDQAALEPWREDIDIIDAALLHHVQVRLTRRVRQKIIVHAGVQCVWVHMPTVRRENWMLPLSEIALGKRFSKLVKLGLLVRKQVSQGTGKGSKSYFGISELLKRRFEELDSRRSSEPFDPSQNTPHSYDPSPDTAQYDPSQDTGQSLSGSNSDRGVSRESGEAAIPPPSLDSLQKAGEEIDPRFSISPIRKQLTEYENRYGPGTCYRIFEQDYLPKKKDKLPFFAEDFPGFLEKAKPELERELKKKRHEEWQRRNVEQMMADREKCREEWQEKGTELPPEIQERLDQIKAGVFVPG